MSGAATVELRFAVPATHPALPGHFPGRPVVPGVVLLDLAFAAARREFGLGPARRLLRAKFTAPVLPEQEVTLRLVRGGGGGGFARVAFACAGFSGEAEFTGTGFTDRGAADAEAAGGGATDGGGGGEA